MTWFSALLTSWWAVAAGGSDGYWNSTTITWDSLTDNWNSTGGGGGGPWQTANRTSFATQNSTAFQTPNNTSWHS